MTLTAKARYPVRKKAPDYTVSTSERAERGLTMGFDFVIPHRKDDLLNKSGINHYVVDEVLPLRVLPGLLQEFKQKLRVSAGTAIVSSFDVFFSVLVNMNNASSDLKELALDLIVKAITGLTTHLTSVLERDSESTLTRQDNLNAVKMSAYVASQLIEAYETEAQRPSAAEVTAAGKGRKGKKAASAAAASAAMGFDWDADKERALTALGHLMQLPLQRLWDPPVVDQEFVNMVTSCCYKLLENQATVKNKGCRDAIFLLLGTAAKRYNHSLGASLKIVQLLQHFEHLSSPLAQLVAHMAAELGVKGMVGEVLREVGRMDVHDLSMDSSGTRCICEFLVELAQLVPDNVLPTMSVLVPFLDEEQSYPMRNAVLGMMGEILVRALTKDDLEPKLRSARDQILDRLEDHVHDVNAYVRSRALQIWLTIVNEKAVPLQRQLHVVDLIIGRLHDKSCQARKYAVQTMTALIKTNPYAANLSIEALTASLEKEQAKLAEMQPSSAGSGNVEAAVSSLPEDDADWFALEPGLRDAARAALTTEAAGAGSTVKVEDDSSAATSAIADDDSAISVAERIRSLARGRLFANAVRLLIAAKEAFPGFIGAVHPLESTNGDTSIMDDDDENELPIADTVSRSTDSLVQELKHLFIAATAERQQQQVAGLLPSDMGADLATANRPADDLSRQHVLVGYLKDCLAFAKKIQAAIPIICQLLGSKTNTDVMEAIDFFVTSYEFGVAHAMAGITKMLSLVWSREQAVKDAVVEAYKRIYVGSGQLANSSDDGRPPASRGGGTGRGAEAARAVSNLIALVLSATIGELTSLEELVAELVRRGDMAASLLQSLWQRFTMKVPGTTQEESRAALILLGMAASADVDIVRSNVDVLIADGLGSRALTDFWLARDTCIVLLKLTGNDKPKAGQYAEQLRFPREHEMFTRLIEVLVTGFPDLQQTGWVPLSEQAANVIYRLSENPDETCGLLIKRLAGVLVSSDPHSVGMLTRLVSLSGHVAFRQLIHLDVAIFGELKRRLALAAEKQHPREKKAANTAAASNLSRLSVASRRSIAATPKKDTSDAVEEELGLTGAAAEDAEMEYIRKITEQDTVSGNSLMGILAPLVVKICSSPAKYSDPTLQAAASLALAKFMLISSEFCDGHLQLLFTILERSENVVIRSNTIVALGDLTFRFPNLIEPWTPHLYARLRDPSAAVRKSTTMVLSHLILNDMVKVKGQISEMAMCTVDADERIAALAKVFFSELAKKGNTVYNIMPDVISRLSDETAGTTEENFRSVMKFLFSFIEKERQCETIIEKLCLRFRATRSERQWRDLAFCLSLLSYSEKGVRKLQEHFACFGDKLGGDEVHECFLTIVANARKLAKVEAKAAIDELEQRIEECHLKGAEDEAAARKADGVAKKAGRRSTTATAGSRSCARRRPSSALTQRTNNADAGSSPATPPGTVDRGKRTRQASTAAGRKSTAKKGPAAATAGPSRQKGRQPRLELSSSEADDDFDDAVSAPKGRAVSKKPATVVAPTPSRKRRVNPPLPTFSDEDEEDEAENGEDAIAGWTAEESADQSRIEADLEEEAENVSPTALLRSESTRKPSKTATKTKMPPSAKSGGSKAMAPASSAATGQRRKR